MGIEYQDYYQTLGVSREATEQELHRAYRKLARKYHPDVNKEAGAEEKFKKLNEAHQVLKDPELRKRYDVLGKNWGQGQDFQPPPEWQDIRFSSGGRPGEEQVFQFQGQGEFSDFFEALFGGIGGEQFQSRFQNVPIRGEHFEARIEVPLKDLYTSASRSFSLETVEPAKNGGLAKSVKSYDVKIPPGIKEGSAIRLSGQGGPGRSGGKAGDLFLRVRVLPDPNFKISEFDLHAIVPIAPWEAMLGGQVDLRLPDGKSVRLTIPVRSQNEQKLRVKGKGLPESATERGDVIIELQVMLPKEVSPREQELWEELKQASSFNPRMR